MVDLSNRVRVHAKKKWDALTEEDLDHIVGTMTVIETRTLTIDRDVLVKRLRGRYGRGRVLDRDVDLFITGIATLPGTSGDDDEQGWSTPSSGGEEPEGSAGAE